jgi:hypothetical protein
VTQNKAQPLQIEVVNPVAPVHQQAVLPARRLDSLNGKKIALWWNTKSQGDVALGAAAEALEQRFHDITFVRVTEQAGYGRLHTARYDEVKEAGFDAVIAATGD